MRKPEDIVAQAIEDELYARAMFPKLISRPPADFRSAMEKDPHVQTEFMARRILGHYEEHHLSIPAEHALEFLMAARMAAGDGEPHVRCRVEKDLANVFRALGRFDEAEAAVRCANSFAGRTLAREVHAGTIAHAWMALLDSTDHPNEAAESAEAAISAFEKTGAYDRAHNVRMLDACMKSARGQHLQALESFQDASRRARDMGSHYCLAVSHYNAAHCYRGLSDFAAAKRYFAKAARGYRKIGLSILEATALRCVARMSIRMHGEAGIEEMEVAKTVFLDLGSAGEVCRSTIGIMEELLRRDPLSDLTRHCRQLEDEALALGVLKGVDEAIYRLKEATRTGCVTEQILTDAWDAFGSTCGSIGISAVATVQN